jgi:hypothetical protein
MYKIFFSNFGYYSANTSDTIDGAKKIARAAGFDSVIELDGYAVCSYLAWFGFCNMHNIVIELEETG